MTGPELYDILFEKKCNGSFDIEAYAEVINDTKASEFLGHGPHGPNMRDYIIPAGTTVRIGMVSRLGDFGIHEDLDRLWTGYNSRVNPEELVNCRLER